MPTNDERREVAARLRKVSGAPEWATTACCIAELIGEYDYPLWDNSKPLFDRLAELIEPEFETKSEPEVLDADGVPIKVGDTVYFVLDPEPLRVVAIDNYGFIICEGKKDSTFPHPDVLTHKQPDSLERIEGDALKAPRAYWGCYDTRCDFCPAKIDEGKKPYERYPGVTDCTSAQALDLLRRQREVLERGL